jgi:hypothetical protein
MSYDPFRYEETIGLQDVTIYAAAQNHWAVQVEGGGLADDSLAVGSGGGVIRWARDGTLTRVVRLAPPADLLLNAFVCAATPRLEKRDEVDR